PALHPAAVVAGPPLGLPPLPLAAIHDHLHPPYPQEGPLEVVVQGVLAAPDHHQVGDLGEGVRRQAGQDVLEVTAADPVRLAVVVARFALPEKGGATVSLTPGAEGSQGRAMIARPAAGPVALLVPEGGCRVESRAARLFRARWR